MWRAFAGAAIVSCVAACGSGARSGGHSQSPSGDRVEIHSNSGDGELLAFHLADSTTVDVFGTRDAGLAKAITAVRVSNKGGTSTYQFDDLGRPTRANVPNGALFSFKWTSPTEALVTAVTPDGTNLLKTVVTLPAQSKAARARTALARADLVGEGESATGQGVDDLQDLLVEDDDAAGLLEERAQVR